MIFHTFLITKIVCFFILNVEQLYHNPLYFLLRPKKKIPVFLLTQQTLFFYADPAIFIASQKKNEKIFIPTDPNIFQETGQTT